MINHTDFILKQRRKLCYSFVIVATTSDNVSQRTLSYEMLNIGALQKMGCTLLQGHRARVGENCATVAIDAHLYEEVSGWEGVCCDVEVNGIRILGQEAVVECERGGFRSTHIFSQVRGGGGAGLPSVILNSLQAVV